MFPQIVIVSDAAEAPAARELVRQTGVNAAVIETAEEEAAAKVIEVFAGNAGVAVARGRLAAALKNRADIPVIEATLSVQDMAELLEKACAQVQKERPRIAFVGQRYMFSSPETIARILRAEVTILYYTRDEELLALLDQARADQTDCVIGSPLVCAQAQKAGLSSVPIGAARDSLLSALRTAGRLADALRREQRRRQEIQYLIRYSSDAIISLKADHTIRSVNPSAEKALGHSAQELIGQNLLTLEGLGSAAALRKALDNSQPTYGIALQFARASFVANITPMIYEETREGSLVTMQEFAVIDDLDERVRQERRRRGYIAQARFAEFPSKSPAIQPVLREAEAYAPFDVPILITGEPRLPKSRLAECIHNASMRRRNPYVSVDLGTIPPENQFGLLFGQRGGGGHRPGRSGAQGDAVFAGREPAEPGLPAPAIEHPALRKLPPKGLPGAHSRVRAGDLLHLRGLIGPGPAGPLHVAAGPDPARHQPAHAPDPRDAGGHSGLPARIHGPERPAL